MAEALEKQGRKIHWKNLRKEFAEKFAGNSPKFARSNLKIHPKSDRSAEPRDQLVHHRSRSHIASDQRVQPITDTSIARNPGENAVFLVSDRHSIAIADYGFSDRYPIDLKKGSTQTLITIGTLGCASLWLCSTNPTRRCFCMRDAHHFRRFPGSEEKSKPLVFAVEGNIMIFAIFDETTRFLNPNRTHNQPKPYLETIETVLDLYSDKGMFPFLLCAAHKRNPLKIDTFPFSNRMRNRTRTTNDIWTALNKHSPIFYFVFGVKFHGPFCPQTSCINVDEPQKIDHQPRNSVY